LDADLKQLVYHDSRPDAAFVSLPSLERHPKLPFIPFLTDHVPGVAARLNFFTIRGYVRPRPYFPAFAASSA
jgi:hypothetical protein